MGDNKMSNGDGKKIGYGVPSWAWFLFVLAIFFIGLIVYLAVRPSLASKQTVGAPGTPQAQVVIPQPQWYLTWQKLPGEQGDTPQRSAKFRATLDRKDAVLVITDSVDTVWTGTRQSDGSYRGTWKDRFGSEGSFEELIFDPDGKTAHGWVRGTKGERAYLVLQRE